MQPSLLPVYGQTMSAAPLRKQSGEEEIWIACAERGVHFRQGFPCNKYFTGLVGKGTDVLTSEVLLCFRILANKVFWKLQPSEGCCGMRKYIFGESEI